MGDVEYETTAPEMITRMGRRNTEELFLTTKHVWVIEMHKKLPCPEYTVVSQKCRRTRPVQSTQMGHRNIEELVLYRVHDWVVEI
ncbi:hypothetical protein CHS0354_018811 [Potamilus streckersoni]|uniref:Uncharacterized protein n=1 Tax=Potamilus streckersoni TaxID=2493646 RepID=A0AAE0WF16_9BIVA|nr:hypothetical protein CHS0354_018811 [Potamilus streckersoni]